MSLLRFATCGQVDDGKSTLIGRLLYDTNSIPEDVLGHLIASGGGDSLTGFNLAHLTDGLRKEREQGITIDVAYRFFRHGERKFILADGPGHIEYMSNTLTALSQSQVALLLVDAERGLGVHTFRHARLIALAGCPLVGVVVNKMDRVEGSQARFQEIMDELQALNLLGKAEVHGFPVSAWTGEGVVRPASETMPWYAGPTLFDWLCRCQPGSPQPWAWVQGPALAGGSWLKWEGEAPQTAKLSGADGKTWAWSAESDALAAELPRGYVLGLPGTRSEIWPAGFAPQAELVWFGKPEGQVTLYAFGQQTQADLEAYVPEIGAAIGKARWKLAQPYALLRNAEGHILNAVAVLKAQGRIIGALRWIS